MWGNILDLTSICEGKSAREIINRENSLKEINNFQGRHSERINSLKGKHFIGYIISRVNNVKELKLWRKKMLDGKYANDNKYLRWKNTLKWKRFCRKYRKTDT